MREITQGLRRAAQGPDRAGCPAFAKCSDSWSVNKSSVKRFSCSRGLQAGRFDEAHRAQAEGRTKWTSIRMAEIGVR